MDTRLTRNERLRGKSAIDRLFSRGRSFAVFPLRAVYSVVSVPDAPEISLLVSVSKKRFKRAVKRNKVKRLIKETFRLKKSIAAETLKESGKQVHLAILYLDKEIHPYHTFDSRMEELLKRLASEICKTNNSKEKQPQDT
ncbi:MAG TPA: ribonuclease P protein component [Candidatus Gallibacteroides avistercoris]|uniref:Ribonuclease P protein component n=1 Tax=Candidatus Gallibacteroides avistercoris TaxID=2840833 RepID=A0A9D1SCM4_9BACT|nr:ribonuclease P protein component [Candidatus Gallibacteroides avistercoris]